MARLLSVNVGLPRDVTWNGKTVRTAVWKSPVTGRRMVRKLDIDGDAQADLAGHGGEQRAVFVYQMDSYHYWERFLVHTEIFGALESITPGMARVVHTPHLPQGPPGSGPPVSFARSGITAAWDRKFASLLELAEACDVPVRWSCRTGVCHTCMTGLIGGSITYNPEPLERPAPGKVLVCCSQPNAARLAMKLRAPPLPHVRSESGKFKFTFGT